MGSTGISSCYLKQPCNEFDLILPQNLTYIYNAYNALKETTEKFKEIGKYLIKPTYCELNESSIQYFEKELKSIFSKSSEADFKEKIKSNFLYFLNDSSYHSGYPNYIDSYVQNINNNHYNKDFIKFNSFSLIDETSYMLGSQKAFDKFLDCTILDKKEFLKFNSSEHSKKDFIENFLSKEYCSICPKNK